MKQALIGVTAVVLFCAAEARAGEVGSDPLQEAQAAYDKAVALYEAGQYPAALTQGEQALALAEAVIESNGDPAVANALDLLGILHGLQGELAQAEPLHQRALAIREEVLGQNDPDVAASLNNLANLYYSQASYARAEPLYLRALGIREQLLGKNHPDVAATLNNLANLYYAQGMPARAEPLHQRALGIWEAALGKNHPHVAQSLNNLGNLYYSQGWYSRAEPLYLRALAIREASLGRDHPDVAASLNNLASLYDAQGFYARAEPLLQRARTIREAAFSKDHPSMVPTLNNLAQFHLAQHRLADALSLFTQAFSISERRLRQEALSFSEARLTHFLEQLRTDEELLYSLLRAYPENEDVRRLVLSVVLLLKGRSAGELAKTSHIVYRSLGPLDRNIFEQLRALRSQLATLVLQDPHSYTLADYQQRLDALAAQGDALEADLAQRSAPLRALAALPALSRIVNQVAAALPPDAALVEFISYTERSLLVKPGTPLSEVPRHQHYLAMVLLPDAHIRALDLGPAEPIDRAASNLRDALARRDAAFLAPAQALYQRAFQPLLPLLGDIHRLFLSPDGQLGLVPFAALHDGQQFLLDSYDFVYLTSGKDLLPRPQEGASNGAVVVLADPDFSAPLPTPPSASGKTLPFAVRSPSVEDLSTLRADLAEQPWAPLPGTREEAEGIQRLFPQAQVFLGPEATKQRLLHLPTPAVLHIATHGFFLEDAPAPEDDSRAIGHFGALDEGTPLHRPPDPLLRSGLILAGARAPQASGAASHPLDSSLVTALELAGLDLWGTQLVVLSACDTGRGDIKLGQGVYGLRRALVVAGAETVVMSLWEVRDDSTRLLMEAYYRNLLLGQGRAFALREAMRALRQTRPHPHDWAPFIVLGSDAPLRLPAPGAQQPPGEVFAELPTNLMERANPTRLR
jgi:CHAT domain-containing protein